MAVIKSFSDRSTYEFWDTGKSKGMPPANLRKAARKKLAILHAVTALEDLRSRPATDWKRWWATGEGSTAFRINDQFRVCFVWRDGDAYEVEMSDYH